MSSSSSLLATLPSASLSTIKRRRSELVTLEKILKGQDDQIRAEINLFEQVEQFFETTTNNNRSSGVVMKHCANFIKAMRKVIENIKGKVVISFFAKPGNVKNYEAKDYDFKRETVTIDKDNTLVSEDEICKRALQRIALFEKTKGEFDCLTVKKLILYIPSPYLLANNIIVRDMPGYDEHSQSDLYKQYIKESMEDTCILVSGIENFRSIFDETSKIQNH